MPETIAKDVVATFHYTLRDGEGTELDTSVGDEPLTYLHGHDNIVPGLETKMAGRSIGDTFSVTVAPGDGYGEHDPEGVAVVPRDAFPGEIEIGMELLAADEEGNPMTAWILDIEEDEVTIDVNHPLSGVTLNFDIEVVELRDALEEELAHGYPHGRSGQDAHDDE